MSQGDGEITLIPTASLRLPSSLLPLIAGLMVWEAAGWLAGFRFLPPFSRVLLATVNLTVSGQIVAPLLGSLLSLVTGYGAAVVLGLLLGVLMGRYRTVEFVLSPFLHAFVAAPKIALVPVLFALFGLSRVIQVVVVFLSAFFVIVLNTMRGVQMVDPEHAEMALAFGATERQLLWRVLLPGALPLTLAGLRLAIGHGVRAMVAAEMFVTLFGLGALLRSFGGRFDAERVFAVLLVVIGVAFACSYLLELVDRRLTSWAGTR